MSSQQDMNRAVIEEFRANGGRVGGRLAGIDLMLLTHTGVRTGRTLVTPLGHIVDGDDLVTGSERSRLWATLVGLKPFLVDFQSKAGAREIPVFVLRRA